MLTIYQIPMNINFGSKLTYSRVTLFLISFLVHWSGKFYIVRCSLVNTGTCLGAYDDNHKAHQIILTSISILGNPSCPKYSCRSSMSLIDLINKDIPGDVFAVEHAVLLYNICRIAVKSYSLRFAMQIITQ